MAIRTTQSVTFRRPFTLSALDGYQPAGTYRLETDEEQIEGLSFNAFHYTSVMLHLPAKPTGGVTGQVVVVDPRELADALLADTFA